MKPSVKVTQLNSDKNGNFFNIFNDKDGWDEAVAIWGCHNEKTYLLTNKKDEYGFWFVQTENIDVFMCNHSELRLVGSVRDLITKTRGME